MRRWVVAFVILFAAVGSSFAQYTAQDSLQHAISRATAVYSDNQLFYISGLNVTTAGTSTEWEYVFHSASHSNYTFETLIGGFFIQSSDTGNLGSELSQLPGTFANSTTAMTTAEANGGASFRATNSSAVCVLSGGAFGYYTPQPTRQLWIADYSNGATGATLIVIMDLVTGSYLTTLGVADYPAQLPATAELNQNYPNPFNPTTTISFSLPTQSNVKLDVFDMTGRKVAEMTNGLTSAGWHEMNFNGSKLASGEYVYRLNANGKVYTRTMTLVK